MSFVSPRFPHTRTLIEQTARIIPLPAILVVYRNFFAEKTNPSPTIVEIYEILKKAPRNAFDRGYPNETSIVFLPDKTALCLLRKDGNPNTAQLGKTDPPFSNST